MKGIWEARRALSSYFERSKECHSPRERVMMMLLLLLSIIGRLTTLHSGALWHQKNFRGFCEPRVDRRWFSCVLVGWVGYECELVWWPFEAAEDRINGHLLIWAPWTRIVLVIPTRVLHATPASISFQRGCFIVYAMRRGERRKRKGHVTRPCMRVFVVVILAHSCICVDVLRARNASFNFVHFRNALFSSRQLNHWRNWSRLGTKTNVGGLHSTAPTHARSISFSYSHFKDVGAELELGWVEAVWEGSGYGIAINGGTVLYNVRISV